MHARTHVELPLRSISSLRLASAPETTPSLVDLLLDHLEAERVTTIFGIPGGPLTAFFEALRRRPALRFVCARHEEGAVFMANSYARVTGELAVACVTSGPGATNALT